MVFFILEGQFVAQAAGTQTLISTQTIQLVKLIYLSWPNIYFVTAQKIACDTEKMLNK